MRFTTFWFMPLVVLLMAVCSCTKRKFHIHGTILDATDKTLYFENVGLNEIKVLDSLTLGEDGFFDFSYGVSDAPEFYRLRIDKQIINIAIDSTETISITATLPTMARDYNVEGSYECSKIKELSLLQMSLQARVNAIIKNPMLRMSIVDDSIASVVDEYKDFVMKNYIYKEPYRAFAYFALFQTLVVGNDVSLIFNPRNDEKDIKAFAAVGTSWDTFYSGSLRAENLHNIALEGMKNIRFLQARENQTIDADKIDLSGIVEITLPDNKGNVHHLSELKGKIVMLDFCSFAQSGTNQRIMAMRDLYNKYHSRGLEIFQVSVDTDEHFWKMHTTSLPWISVNDPNGVNSEYLLLYNVQELPTYYILQKDCTPYKRDVQIDNIESTIEELL